MGRNQTLVTQIHDWSTFTHVDVLDHLPVVDRDQLQASLDRLAALIVPKGPDLSGWSEPHGRS